MKKVGLEVLDLEATTAGGKKILNGVNLKINPGEVHAIMGPNGGGKSTLAAVLMGHPDYKITKGHLYLDGKDLVKLSVDERAKWGLFLGFQYPVEVAGVNLAGFLRMAINQKNNSKISPIAFRVQLIEEAKKLALGEDVAKRALNEGFSGGEKKKSEVLQMAMLKPKYAILDEPDSGLDVDALRYIAKRVNALEDHPGIVLITHYQRILKYIKPDYVHILVGGRIVKSGKADLAKLIEETGYEKYL